MYKYSNYLRINRGLKHFNTPIRKFERQQKQSLVYKIAYTFQNMLSIILLNK